MRSQTRAIPPKADQPNRTVFQSVHGTVRVYTRRHINGCQFTGPDFNRCTCPKWIYSKARGAKPVQAAAGTPSFTEACEVAQRKLRGFDPEIRAARQMAAPPAPGISIADAVTRYLGVLGSRKITPRYLRSTEAVFIHRPARTKGGRALLNPSLLDFLAGLSDPITRMEQLSTELLEDWSAAWLSNDLSSRLWRTVATSFFRWALGRGYLNRMPSFGEGLRSRAGNRCGYFTDAQYAQLLATLPFCRPTSGRSPANYAERLGAFMDLGRWGGMAVADIVRFNPAVNLSDNNVLSYRRTKTGQMAVVLLQVAVAARLRSIPAEAGSDPEQPFFFRKFSEEATRDRWRDRFQKLCAKAGIVEIETEAGATRLPHPHMLRDTFAIDAITRGVKLENVAKMLGHATTAMTQRSYLFWIQKRLDYCIEDQREALTRVQVPAAPLDAGADRLRRPLVN
jgi:integrase